MIARPYAEVINILRSTLSLVEKDTALPSCEQGLAELRRSLQHTLDGLDIRRNPAVRFKGNTPRRSGKSTRRKTTVLQPKAIRSHEEHQPFPSDFNVSLYDSASGLQHPALQPKQRGQPASSARDKAPEQ